MINFDSNRVFELKAINVDEGKGVVLPLLIDGEDVFASFQSMRDMVIFTNKRIISVNVQGMTGKKKDFTSLPYSKVQLYSVETAGVGDTDTEMDLWFNEVGKIHFEFKSSFDIKGFNKYISAYIL